MSISIPPPPGDDGEKNYLPPEPPNPQPEPEQPEPDSSPLNELLAASDADSKEEILRFAHRNGLAEDDPSIQQMLIMAKREQALASALNVLTSKLGCLPLIQQERRELEAAQKIETERRHDEALAAEANEREVREENRNLLKCVKSQNLWVIGLLVVLNINGCWNTMRASAVERAASGVGPAAEQLTAYVENAREMQALTHQRLILTSKQNALEKEWRDLQIAWRQEGETEKNKQTKAELDSIKTDLDAEWKQQHARESEALKGPARTPIQQIDRAQGGQP